MLKRSAFLLQRLAFVAVLCMAFMSLAWGQGAEVTSGTLTGTVTDISGAVVANAKVQVTNPDKGFSREAQTDNSGGFSVPQLPAGTYTVTVASAGFSQEVVKGVVVSVGGTRNLRVTMKVGQVAEKVEVQDIATAVDVSTTDVSSTIDPQQVRDLPLNQRSYVALVVQQPGVVVMTNKPPASPVTARFGIGSSISVGGVGGGNVAYLQDGVSIQNAAQSAPGTVAGGDLPGVEATGEFKIATHNFSAAYGGAGAVISFSTKSGTNKLHGSVYDYLRNDIFDGQGFQFGLQPSPQPYRRNQFGVSIGGPIKKDKTFFYANYEGLRQRLTTSQVAFVPSQCALQGGVGGSNANCINPSDSTQFPTYQVTGVARDGSGNPIADPSTGFYDYVPIPISQPIHDLMLGYPAAPVGNDIYLNCATVDCSHSSPAYIGPDNYFNTGVSTTLYSNRQPIRQDFGLIHIDHNLTARDTLFARYTITDGVGSNAFYLPTYEFDRVSRLQNLLLKWTRIFSTNVVNTVSAGVNRSVNLASIVPTYQVLPDAYTGDPALKGQGPVRVGNVSGGAGNGASLSPLANESQNPNNMSMVHYSFNDDLAITHGRHTIKLGGFIQRNQDNLVDAESLYNNSSFNSLNDLLAQNPNITLAHTFPQNPNMYYRYSPNAWYVEDAWKAKDNLTITAGLRHEFTLPFFSEKYGRMGMYPHYLQDDPTLVKGQWANNYTTKQFQPRLGIAWDPTNKGKLVFKTGIGIFNSNIAINEIASAQIFSTPYPVVNLVPGSPLGMLPESLCGTGVTCSILPPAPFPNCASCGASYYPVLFVTYGLPIKSPTTYQWNFSTDYDLGHHFGLSLVYAGSQARHADREWNGQANKPCGKDANGLDLFPPACTSAGVIFPNVAAPGAVAAAGSFSNITSTYDGYGNYNALSIEVTRNYANGLTFNTSYTWAKAMSTSDMALGAYTGQAGESADPINQKYDYSESMYSIRHRATLNVTYDLPFGRGRQFANGGGRAVDAVVGGWSLNALGSFQSGIPFSVLDGIQISGVNDAISDPDRPNQVKRNGVKGGWQQYIDPTAFALQAPGHLGTSARNAIRGPGFSNLDLSMRKQFRTTESTNMEFVAEAFNIMNHTNFALPANSLFNLDGSPNPQAGRISSTVGNPRQLQFALRFNF